MEKIKQQLEEQQIGKVKLNEPLKKHTTIKIGGPADLFIEPDSIENLKKTLQIVKDHGLSVRIIGRGSNLLIPDEGIRGAVVKLGPGLDHLEEDGNTIQVGAGYPMIKLAMIMSRKGLGGLEFAGGIPGSVGGAVYMNAGAHGSDISEILVKAHILFEDGTMEWLTKDEMKFSYRTSVLQNERKGYCLEAVFELNPGSKEEIVAEIQKFKDYRRETQPWSHPCAGSIFRNPLPEYAGKLVEEVGLKGHKIGDAQISELHANFIVNTADASYEDVMALIQHVKDTIWKEKQIKIETEVEIVSN
ncbi:UDP-N-acetylmuramate dehydrogenase [Thalassobacillus hwangdonensis]|uniref:UDP-N-acetylenolpyruvoylglucosamine reductase n=1 Tax=Thalassobacillus hwangdonensis TaxID=546108 RepID=A0ABW3L0H2_9BACI